LWEKQQVRVQGLKVLPAERARQFVGGRDRERDWVHYIPLDRHLVWITFAGRWKCFTDCRQFSETNKQISPRSISLHTRTEIMLHRFTGIDWISGFTHSTS